MQMSYQEITVLMRHLICRQLNALLVQKTMDSLHLWGVVIADPNGCGQAQVNGFLQSFSQSWLLEERKRKVYLQAGTWLPNLLLYMKAAAHLVRLVCHSGQHTDQLLMQSQLCEHHQMQCTCTQASKSSMRFFIWRLTHILWSLYVTQGIA